jgi:ketosteroid isomerase-like protein
MSGSDDIERVNAWFARLAEHVRAIDFVGARPLFAEDLVAFGTFSDFITGREAVEAAQWRKVWPFIRDFRWRLDGVRALVAADRLSAVGMAIFDSTGFREDGSPYPRPGRATVAFRRARIGDDWVAQHTHMSLFRGVPDRSFGAKP